MTHYIKLVLLLLCILPVMTACKDKMNDSYLTEHPLVLKDEFSRCQTLEQKTAEQSAECEIVMSAAAKISAILEEQQANPEKFGQRILKAEFDMVNAKNVLRDARKALLALKVRRAAPNELRAIQDAVLKAKKDYQDREEEVKVLLAVVGLNSPE